MLLTGFSFPPCIAALDKNLADVRRVLDAAPTDRNTVHQPRRVAEALYRGAVVMTCATWEVFVEELALEALHRLVRTYTQGGKLSPSGQEVAARTMRRIDREGVKWQDPTTFGKYRDCFLGRFNTPKTANVDGLFDRALDLPTLSIHWSWKNATPRGMSRQLDAFVGLRGDIAHRTKGSQRLRKNYVIEQVVLIERLAILSSNVVWHWLEASTAAPPHGWDVIPLSAATTH